MSPSPSEPRRTEFLPAQRASDEAVRRQRALILATPSLARVLDAVHDIVVFLNPERQIVFANKAAIDCLQACGGSPEIGARWGQALRCEHADEDCGTTRFCRSCGAARATWSAQRGREALEECRITQAPSGRAFDFLVSTARLALDGEEFTVFSAVDVGDQKRRQALERIFFHDVLNTAVGLRGLLEILPEADPEQKERFLATLHGLSEELIEEISTQRDLSAAESGELAARPGDVDSLALLLELAAAYAGHGVGKGKRIDVDPASRNVRFESDKTLVRRVVGNMLKNALEASREGEAVVLGCGESGGGVELWVRSPAAMPPEARGQVFQRSFTTKGSGRGLGTYSMKLLTERYLGGEVGFESAEGRGTRFWARYPLAFPARSGSSGS